MEERAPDEDGPAGCFAALGIGVGTIVLNVTAFSLLTGQPVALGEEWGVYLFQMALVGAPFALLALAGVRGRGPWGVGLALTLAFWGYYLFEGVRYQWNPDGSGANIGLGLIMFASPILIAAAAFAAHAVGKR